MDVLASSCAAQLSLPAACYSCTMLRRRISFWSHFGIPCKGVRGHATHGADVWSLTHISYGCSEIHSDDTAARVPKHTIKEP